MEEYTRKRINNGCSVQIENGAGGMETAQKLSVRVYPS